MSKSVCYLGFAGDIFSVKELSYGHKNVSQIEEDCNKLVSIFHFEKVRKKPILKNHKKIFKV